VSIEHFPYRNESKKIGFKLALFATVLTFCVVVLGAYTRLTDAGLGCPDWPGCYGHILVSKTNPETANNFDAAKAWTEMAHRYLAGILGIVIFALAILSLRNKRCAQQPIILPLCLVLLVVFQALLGMWTVTLKLYPLVVMAHLLGGITTLSLLWCLCLMLKPDSYNSDPTEVLDRTSRKYLRVWALVGLLVLIIQLFSGGWTSANYAALVCPDFPLCQGQTFIFDNFWKAFNLYSAGVPGSPGEPLPYLARVTIHMTHRMGALLTALVIGWLVYQAFSRSRSIGLKFLSMTIAILLIIQILLGITNILALLPLPIAVLHNAVAALLLLSLITLNYYLYSKREYTC
jgi:cytochrome c oxidase assembly protein subunit 15